jgi:5'-nucleotidase (lipoprotein e(P4) family)
MKAFPARQLASVALALAALTACTCPRQAATAPPVPVPSPASHPTNEHTVQAVLWVQRSGEYRALCHQAFNLARRVLDEELKANPAPKKRAVVVDIDETVLDNSPYQARLIKTRQGYATATWRQWVDLARAEAMAGAVEFLKHAASRGIEVFYISNRRAEEHAGTLANLRAKGFPHADDAHLLLRTAEGSKTKRRAAVSATHEIILLMGDNLNDFSDVFEGKDPAGRIAEVEKLAKEFGRRFIVLPNPLYGDFEDSIYRYNRSLPEAEKDTLRKGALKDY